MHYNVRGSGRDITVQAESSAEECRTVMDMFPNAVVTDVHRVNFDPHPGDSRVQQEIETAIFSRLERAS